MPTPRSKSMWNQTSVRYHCAALAHYSVLLPIALGGALSALSWTLAVATFLVGELVLVGALPRSGAFRKGVDGQSERRAAVTMRAHALGRMGVVHTAELAQLEYLAACIRRRCEHGGAAPLAAPDPAVERWLGLDRLLALYVNLAIAHRFNVEAFRAEDRAALEVENEHLNTLAGARRGPSEVWIERRRSVLQRRHETWVRATEERDLIVHALATIAGVIRWMHELCLVVLSDSVRSEVEDVLASWESNGAALREVSTLCRADEHAVDPHVLALGREAMAKSSMSGPEAFASRQLPHEPQRRQPAATAISSSEWHPQTAVVPSPRAAAPVEARHVEPTAHQSSPDMRPQAARTVVEC